MQLTKIRQAILDLVIRKKILFLMLGLTLSLSIVISGTLYSVASSRLHNSLRLRLELVASTSALLIDGEELDQVQTEADRNGPAWKKLVEKLMKIQRTNRLDSVYLMRASTRPGGAEFVVDTNKPTHIGQEYDLKTAPSMAEGFLHPSGDKDILTDQFGSALSGYAPIFRKDRTVAGLIGLDMDASDVLQARRQFKWLAGGITFLFLLGSIFASLGFSEVLTRPILDMRDRIKQLTEGQLETRMLVRSRDEIGQLSLAINRMLDSLSLYLPIKLVGHILNSTQDLKLGGKCVRVTAFFSDIAGFTSLSEKLSPEETVAILNEYLSEMTDIIESQGGTLDKYIGDAIMAFWGAPVEVKDHAILACEAALRQRESIRVLQERWKAESRPVIHFRIGLNSGEVIAGNMGSNRRLNYTVVGDAVNLASRLESANKHYGTDILLGESTHGDIRDSFECRKIDRVRVSGKEIAVTIFELLGRKGEVSENVLSARDLFEKALGAYFSQDWDVAEKHFQAVKEFLPDDAAVRIYLDRIKRMRANPPGPDWDLAHDLRRR